MPWRILSLRYWFNWWYWCSVDPFEGLGVVVVVVEVSASSHPIFHPHYSTRFLLFWQGQSSAIRRKMRLDNCECHKRFWFAESPGIKSLTVHDWPNSAAWDWRYKYPFKSCTSQNVPGPRSKIDGLHFLNIVWANYLVQSKMLVAAIIFANKLLQHLTDRGERRVSRDTQRPWAIERAISIWTLVGWEVIHRCQKWHLSLTWVSPCHLSPEFCVH